MCAAAGPALSLSRRRGLAVIRLILLVLLAALLINPVDVAQSDGTAEPAEMFLLADASTSMALADGGQSRWSQALDIMSQALEASNNNSRANPRLFKFGRTLQAL